HLVVGRACPRPACCDKYTGLRGAASSSSDGVGSRCSTKPLRFQPPMQVMKSPTGTVRPFSDHLLELCDRGRRFNDSHLVTGVDSATDEVNMRVNHARNDL